jgi:flavodoxin
MKTLITYYSYSGITEQVINIYTCILAKKGDITVQRLKPKNEITTFMGQCRAAFMRQRAELQDGIKYSATDHDLVLLGLPVWAFAPVPAMNTFLDKVSGLDGKRVIVLLTSGSGAGVKKCFGNIRSVLGKKGASKIDEINIPNSMMKDENFIISSLEKLL